MDPFTIAAAAAGVGGELISGLFGNSQQKKALNFAQEQFEYQKNLNQDIFARQDLANAQNFSFAREQTAGAQAYATSERLAAQQFSEYAAQRAYEQQYNMDATRVQRLVADANAAGIHPLAALGAQLNSPMVSPAQSPGAGQASQSPASAGAASPGFSPIGFQPGNPFGDAIGSALNLLSNMVTMQGDVELKKAQIRNLDAESARMLSSATSRTLISRGRGAATGGPGTHTAPGQVVIAPGIPIDTTPGLSEYGDLAKRYGMLISEISGWLLGATDAARTTNRRLLLKTPLGKTFGSGGIGGPKLGPDSYKSFGPLG